MKVETKIVFGIILIICQLIALGYLIGKICAQLQ